MANFDIGGYEFDDTGGQLTITEKSSGKTFSFDGDSISGAGAITAKSVNDVVSSKEQGSLASAVSNASAGDTVVFDEDETITSTVNWKNGVDLRAKNGVTLTVNADIGFAIGLPSPANDITIEGLNLDLGGDGKGARGIGRASGAGYQRVTIKNCQIINAEIDAINMQNENDGTNRDVRILDNVLHSVANNVGHGLFLGAQSSGAEMHDISVRGNTVDPGGAQGLGIYNTGSVFATNVVVSDNMVAPTGIDTSTSITLEGDFDGPIIADNAINLKDAPSTCDGINCDNFRQASITGNTVIGNGNQENGIDINHQNSSEQARRSVIANNAFADLAQSAIKIESNGERFIIANNYMENTGQFGIQSDSVKDIITGNHVLDIGMNGIEAGAGTTVVNNYVNTTGDLGVAGGQVIRGNRLVNNDASAIRTGENNALVTENVIDGAGSWAIEYTGSGGTFANNVCTGTNFAGDLQLDGGTGHKVYFNEFNKGPVQTSNSPSYTALFNFANEITEGGAETTVDDGGTIAHGLVGTPTSYNVESRDAGTMAHVTAVDGTTLTVEVLNVSDGTSAGLDNNVVWEAQKR